MRLLYWRFCCIYTVHIIVDKHIYVLMYYIVILRMYAYFVTRTSILTTTLPKF